MRWRKREERDEGGEREKREGERQRRKCFHKVPYSGKLSREKAFANFMGFSPLAKVFSANFLGRGIIVGVHNVTLRRSSAVTSIDCDVPVEVFPVHQLHPTKA